MNKRLLTVAALAFIAGVASAGQDGPLKYTGKVDAVRKFKFNGSIQVNGMDVKLSSDVSSKVIKVDDAGLVSIQVVPKNLVMIVGGQSIPGPASPALIKIIRPDGSLAELHGEGTYTEVYRLETLTSVKLPDTPIKADKTWTWDIPSDSKTGVVKATVIYKVLGDEKVAGVDAWKVSRTAKELTGDSPASDVGTVWINKLDGSVVKEVDTWISAPIHGQVSVPGTFTSELQP